MNIKQQVNPIVIKQIAQQKYLNRLLNGLIFVLIIGSIYLIDRRPEVVSLEKAYLAIAIIWVSLYPTWQYLVDRHRPPMPFMPLVGIFYATSFGLPIFSGELKIISRFSLQAVDPTSLTLVLIALVCFNISFYSAKATVWQRVVPLSLPRKFSVKAILTLIWTFTIFHLMFLYIPFVKTIPSIGQLLDPIAYIAYGIFFILWKRKKLALLHKALVLLVCTPLEIIPRLTSGLLSQVMLLGLFMVIIAFVETKRIPILLVAISLGIYLIFNPVKSDFRRAMAKQYVALSPIEKVQVFTDLVYRYYTSPPIYNSKKPKSSESDRVISRSAHIMVFAAVVRDTPDRVPYWNGQSYLPLFTSFIPRFIWPDKPSETTGNDFGQRYGYLDKQDRSTSFNLPWLVELYANFGDVGVILGMSFIGVFLAFLEQKFNRPEMQPLEFVTGTTILFRLIYQESNFSLMVGSVLLLSISLLAIYRVFLGK